MWAGRFFVIKLNNMSVGCASFDITLKVMHIPGVDNKVAVFSTHMANSTLQMELLLQLILLPLWYQVNHDAIKLDYDIQHAVSL